MYHVSSTRLFRVAVIVLCLGGIAEAQTAATAAIEGLVTDATGAVLPGVTVTVRNMDTNLTREFVTDGTGRYSAAALQPGRYEVSATYGLAGLVPFVAMYTLPTSDKLSPNTYSAEKLAACAGEPPSSATEQQAASAKVALDRTLAFLKDHIG